jgi:hypothetical protein
MMLWGGLNPSRALTKSAYVLPCRIAALTMSGLQMAKQTSCPAAKQSPHRGILGHILVERGELS